LMLTAGIAVVTMRDIIRCGLAMIVCFIALAGIYVQIGAPLVAAAQVIVYIGAISVLVLFHDYVLPFEVVSVLLLAAVIGGVFLAKREDPREETLQ